MFKRSLRKDLDIHSDLNSRISDDEFVSVDMDFSSRDGLDSIDDDDDDELRLDGNKSDHSSTGPNSSSFGFYDDDIKRIQKQDAKSKQTTASEDLASDVGHESKGLYHLRSIGMIALLITAIAVSTSVYFLIKNSETEEFQYKYDTTSNLVIARFLQFPTQTIGSMVSLKTIIEASSLLNSIDNATINSAQSASLSLPLQNFQTISKNAQSLSDSLYITMNHYVDNRNEWERYVWNNIQKTSL